MASIVIEVPALNKTYTLEFSRRVILKMEKEKFLERINTKDVDVVYDFVRYALLKNHPDITEHEVETLVDSVPLESKEGHGLNDLLDAMSKILESSLSSLQEKSGNAKWEVR